MPPVPLRLDAKIFRPKTLPRSPLNPPLASARSVFFRCSRSFTATPPAARSATKKSFTAPAPAWRSSSSPSFRSSGASRFRFAAAELNSLLPVQGGFYRWSRAAFGDFWGFQCGWWNWTGTFLLNSLYGVLLMDYLSSYFPWITGNVKWLGACLALCVLSYLNARGIQVAGWLSVALLVAVLIPVAWLCIVALFQLHHNPVLPVHAAGPALRQRLRQRPRARDVELRWLRTALQHDRRDERFAAHLRPPARLEHADERPHLRSSHHARARRARQLAGMEDGLHRHRVAAHRRPMARRRDADRRDDRHRVAFEQHHPLHHAHPRHDGAKTATFPRGSAKSIRAIARPRAPSPSRRLSTASSRNIRWKIW